MQSSRTSLPYPLLQNRACQFSGTRLLNHRVLVLHTIRGKGSVAATKCHVASESFTMQGLQKKFHDLAKTSQEIPIYGQVFTRKRCERLIPPLNSWATQPSFMGKFQISSFFCWIRWYWSITAIAWHLDAASLPLRLQLHQNSFHRFDFDTSINWQVVLQS